MHPIWKNCRAQGESAPLSPISLGSVGIATLWRLQTLPAHPDYLSLVSAVAGTSHVLQNATQWDPWALDFSWSLR